MAKKEMMHDDVAADKKLIKKAFKMHDAQEHKGGKGTEIFETSDRCIACHNGLTTSTGEDISIGFNWRPTMMANAGRARYLWVAVVPMLFVTTTTMTAGFQLLERFWALTKSTVPGDPFKGYLNCFLIVAMMICVAIILWESFRRWIGPPLRSEVSSATPAAGAA